VDGCDAIIVCLVNVSTLSNQELQEALVADVDSLDDILLHVHLFKRLAMPRRVPSASLTTKTNKELMKARHEGG